MEMSCAAASMPESDRPDLLSSVEFGVLMPQSNSPVLFFFFFSLFVTWLWPSRVVILCFSAISIETHSSSAVHSKKVIY